MREHVFEAWRRVSRRYGFSEYDGPPLEPLDLYVEKSGQEIVGQLYNFEDKGGRAVALRPEMTPSLARILAERSRGMAKPIRWFTLPQLFRYERQQRGRLREHFQLNVDIVGEGGVAADAEVLAVAIDVVRELGLTEEDFAARVNDRRLVAAVLTAVGVPEASISTCLSVIDKLDPARLEAGVERLVDSGLDADLADSVIGIFDDPSWDGLVGRFGGDPRVAEALQPLQEHREILSAMGLGGFLEFDLKIVRGLAYYTGIVFELFDRQGELRAICGGGRYDRLLELVGGEPLPAVGFGMGDVVLTELLKDRGLAAPRGPSADDFIVWVEDGQRSVAMGLAHALRDQGRRVMYNLRSAGVGKQLKAAARSGASRAIILGPDEVAEGVATVRDLTSGEEGKAALDDLLSGAGEA